MARKKPAAETPAPNRGHWPKGKRRNPDTVAWSRTLLSLQALLSEHWQRGAVSESALAIAIGVNKTTVGRWLSGTDRPAAETQTLVRQWVQNNTPRKPRE